MQCNKGYVLLEIGHITLVDKELHFSASLELSVTFETHHTKLSQPPYQIYSILVGETIVISHLISVN